MQTIEVRVRPVIRHIVTEFHADPETRAAGVATVGEFANEEQAEKVAAALRGQHEPRLWVAVERGDYSVATNAIYFQTAEDAAAFVEKARADERDFHVFSRVVQGNGYPASGHGPVPDVPPRVST